MLLAATLGWFVQAIGIVAVVFIVVLVKRFSKFEAQLAAAELYSCGSSLCSRNSLSVQSRWAL
jgi:hypothetical protein